MFGLFKVLMCPVNFGVGSVSSLAKGIGILLGEHGQSLTSDDR